jgi:hypothetical protein
VTGGRVAVQAPEGTVERVVRVGDALRVELLRPARDGALATWILASPVPGG